MTKKALFLVGGWEGHEPQDCANLFSGLLENTAPAGYKQVLQIYLRNGAKIP